MADVPTTQPAPAPERDLITVINQQLADWKNKGAHVLAPLTLQTIPPFFRPVVVAVQLDANPDHKEVYPQRGGGFSVSSLGWKKIGDAIGIKWIPEQCGRTDDGRNARKVCYRMVGKVRGMDGLEREVMGDKEIDLDVIEEETRDGYRQKAEDYLNDPVEGPKFRAHFPTAADVGAWITEKTRVEVLQMKKHMLARAQSGAIARATKNIGIRETYTAAELAKPFVFPKLVFSPDVNNPHDRQFLLEQATGATHRLYGGPVPTIPPPPILGIPREDLAHEVPFLDPGSSSEAPSADEVCRADFAASEVIGQVEILEGLMKRKAYDQKKIKGLMAAWSAADRAAFLERLLELPDAPVEKGATRPLPFE